MNNNVKGLAIVLFIVVTDPLYLEQIKSGCPTPSVLMLTPLATAPECSCYIPQVYKSEIITAFEDCNMQRQVLIDTAPQP